MLFNSVEFAFFYLIVTSLFFLLPHKFRWVLLLAASCYFYMAFVPVYILILGFTIVIDYFAGIYIEKTQGAGRKMLLVVSLVSNIGILVFFKYFNFLNTNISYFLNHFNYHNPIPFLQILLPIGLSFHTFQAMSYTIEVYRGNQTAEKHFGIYSLYVMFYPQLVAGPIERPQNLLHQFRQQYHFDYTDMTSGLKQMAWGLFKKVVIADRLSILVNNVYHDPHQHNVLSLIIAALFFAFQIFCDFSGYSDIAIGAARTMGFRLMKNFNNPYSSKSVTEFWARWHISLSTWFRDYLYIPLGGNRVTVSRRLFNLLVVFLISGLWHGAGWTFIAWGLLNGLAIAFELLTVQFRRGLADRLPKALYSNLSLALTFIYMCLTWVFFRAPSLSSALYIVKSIILGLPGLVGGVLHHRISLGDTGVNGLNLLLSFSVIGFLIGVQWLHGRINIIEKFGQLPLLMRWTGYVALILSILSLGVFDHSQFIYFQF